MAKGTMAASQSTSVVCMCKDEGKSISSDV